MKLKDMQAAKETGTQVAVGRKWQTPKPATILALRQPRRVHSGERWDFTGHQSMTGVLVKYADGKEEIVAPVHVQGIYTEVKADTDHAARTEELKRQAQAQQKLDCEAAVARLGVGTVSAKYERNHNNPYKLIGWQVTLSPREAATLAERIA